MCPLGTIHKLRPWGGKQIRRVNASNFSFPPYANSAKISLNHEAEVFENHEAEALTPKKAGFVRLKVKPALTHV